MDMAHTRTVGISPKVAVPTSVLLAAGVLLALLDLAAIVDVDDTLWQALLAAGGVTGGAGAAASPGTVAHRDEAR
jgi:hypothetical protein